MTLTIIGIVGGIWIYKSYRNHNKLVREARRMAKSCENICSKYK